MRSELAALKKQNASLRAEIDQLRAQEDAPARPQKGASGEAALRAQVKSLKAEIRTLEKVRYISPGCQRGGSLTCYQARRSDKKRIRKVRVALYRAHVCIAHDPASFATSSSNRTRKSWAMTPSSWTRTRTTRPTRCARFARV
jgi:hypothetical protein